MALTPQQTQKLQTAIERRRQVLLAEPVAALIGELDQADLGRDLSELRALEAARERLREGTYGTCIDCGRDIGLERLNASPAALRCINDQTAYEKVYGGAKPSSL